MARRVPSLLIAALAAVAFAGCGESEKDKYIDDYKPLNDRLLKIGESLGTGLGNASSQTNAALAKQFGKFAADLGDLNKEIEALDTPGELKDESTALTGRIDSVVKDLETIVQAAKRGNPKAAAAASMDLVGDASKVNEAQNKLAKATGAKVGER